jgi:hypothetical protein
MLSVAVQPPARAQSGVALYPPLAGRLSSETNIFDELSQFWAVATLIDYSGEVLDDQLGGKVADSAHPLPETTHSSSSSSNGRKDRAYFYFPDLVINEPGRYRIRISLMQMDYSGDSSLEGTVVVRESVDSHSITVQDEPASSSRPSK